MAIPQRSAEQINEFCEHLASCPQCQSFVDQLSDNRELRRWAPARDPLVTPVPSEPVLADLLENLRATPPPGTGPPEGIGETGGASLSFLGAPQQPGDLGTLGPYRVLAELARGGMGIVLLAYDPDLRRKVAIKVLPPHRADERARSRFVREAQAAAGIDHDHVVPVHAVANPADGPPYLVMQYVEGLTLRQRIQAEGRLNPFEAARIGAQVTEGLAAAHDAGLIHRDIKPANIILDRASGRAKIMDFGLVRLTYLPGGTTQEGTLMGTPEYMSPEQVRDPDHLDARSDVYGLGVTLYEALTGEVPFRGVAHMVHQQILQDEPRPPRRLNDTIPRDLETICLHCLRKEAGKRYPTARVLADDLRRFLNGDPIQARPVSWRERGWRWARRRPGIAALLALVFSVTALGLVLVTGQWQRAETARREVETKNYYKNIALAARESLAKNLGHTEELLDACQPELRGWEWHYLKRRRYETPRELPQPDVVLSVAYSPSGEHLASGCVDGTVEVWNTGTWQRTYTWRKHRSQVYAVAFSPDSRYLATAGHDTQVLVWKVSSGELLYTLRAHTETVFQLAFSPDGKFLASASQDKTVRLWDMEAGQEGLIFREHRDAVRSLAFQPDGRRLISSDADGNVKIWDPTSGGVASTHRGQIRWVSTMALSSDGRRPALASWDGSMELWESLSGKTARTLRGHAAQITSLAFSPDGQRLASAGDDKALKIWDTTTGQEAMGFDVDAGAFVSLAFSPDGLYLACGCVNHVAVLNATPLAAGEKNEQALTLHGHEDAVVHVTFSPDNKDLASASRDGSVRLWDALSGQERLAFRGHKAIVSGVAFSPDSRRVASGSWDGEVKIWSAATGQEFRTLCGQAGFVYDVAWSADGRSFASAHSDGTVILWDLKTGEPIHRIPAHSAEAVGVTFSRDGTLLATAGGRSHQGKVWDVASAQEICSLSGAEVQSHWGISFHPDGQSVASGGGSAVVLIWDAKTAKPIRSLKGHTSRVLRVVFSPDGRRIASASWDQTVRVWDAATGRQLALLRGHAGHVLSVAFSPDGRRLASSSGYAGKGEIKIWDATLWEKPANGGR